MDTTVLIDTAAQLAGVSRRTIYYRIREGKLKTVPLTQGQRVTVASLRALYPRRFVSVPKFPGFPVPS